MDVIELKHQQALLTGSTLNLSEDLVNVGDADAPDFGGSDPVFGEDVVNFFE